VFHFQSQHRTGITTEMAAVATFALSYLTATPVVPWGSNVAIATAIVAVAFLESKRALQKLIHETITETEFSDTLWFLAIIFLILPVLPDGEFGIYHFFAPRKVWVFVILLSSISYVGYFLQKFLGADRGLELTAVLGGLASTTAATASFAKSYAADRAPLVRYLRAAVIANTMHFPRIFVVVLVAAPDLAMACLPALAAMTAAGLLVILALRRRQPPEVDPGTPISLGNPFRLVPALKLGAVFVGILFLVRAAAAHFGSQALLYASAIGGLMDVDAIALSTASMVDDHKVLADLGSISVLIAIVANAVFKTAMAFAAGARPLAWRLGLVFLSMFSAGAVAWFIWRAAGV
jgi:uncharacterized membrane protein (DUF4010 family)